MNYTNENYLIDKKELAELRSSRSKLIALENGGVDSWEGYEESICQYEKLTGNSVSIDKPVAFDFVSGDWLFFQNNPCEFISYIGDTYCMIKLYAGFDIDIDSSNYCTQCMIGGGQSGYLGAHSCEESQDIIDSVFKEIDESRGYVVVPVSIQDVHREPVILINHKALAEVLIKERAVYKQKTLAAKSKIIDLESEISRLEKQIELRSGDLSDLNWEEEK